MGGILGAFLTFNTEGLDFVMTAMFVVIFLEQWLKEKKHYTALIGVLNGLYLEKTSNIGENRDIVVEKNRIIW